MIIFCSNFTVRDGLFGIFMVYLVFGKVYLLFGKFYHVSCIDFLCLLYPPKIFSLRWICILYFFGLCYPPYNLFSEMDAALKLRCIVSVVRASLKPQPWYNFLLFFKIWFLCFFVGLFLCLFLYIQLCV